MISQKTIEEVKERASLVEVAAELVKLRRQGSSYSGLCPFHNENTPSFHIRDNGTFYHCFGCGASGNVISFVMEARGLSFPDAVEEIAARFGIKVEHDRGPSDRNQKGPDKEKFYRINALAQEYFQTCFKKAPPAVVAYLKERSLTREAIQNFGIGFAPAERSGLLEFLRGKKVPEELLIQSGIVKRNERGELYDTFRARLIFPIFVERNRIAGFGGRILKALISAESAKLAPKYLNSPESPVYEKSKTFYGLPQAMEATRKEKEVYLVEGYMDLIGLWQAGVRNVLATCGTAVTEHHVKRLAHLVQRANLLFDGDEAGTAAAGKSFPTFLNSGIDVFGVMLPDGEDPDTFVLKHPGKEIEAVANLEKRHLFDCYLDYILGKHGASGSTELGAALKGKVAKEVLSVIDRVKNGVELNELLERAAMRLRVSAGALSGLARSQSQESEARTQAEPPRMLMPSDVPLKGEIEELPRVDREVLRIVMTKRNEVTATIMSDGELCDGLQPVTLHFISSLAALLSVSEGNEDQVKDRIKILLKEYGPSWINHWRESHEMQSDPDVKLGRSLDQCRAAIRKIKLNQAIRAVEEEILSAESEQRKTELVQQKLELVRQANVLGRGTGLAESLG